MPNSMTEESRPGTRLVAEEYDMGTEGVSAAIPTRVARQEAGQTLALMALVLVGLLAMVALVIDGGNAYAQQRMTQNGTDAAAEAGAVVLANRLVGLPVDDTMVWTAVDSIGNQNEVTITSAEYTDATGVALGSVVGGGTLPQRGVRPTGPELQHVLAGDRYPA
jgi:hypothetical protein